MSDTNYHERCRLNRLCTLWKRPQRRVVWSHDMSLLDFSLHTRRGARYQLRVRINKLGQLGWQARAQSTKRERRNVDPRISVIEMPVQPTLGQHLEMPSRQLKYWLWLPYFNSKTLIPFWVPNDLMKRFQATKWFVLFS